MKHNDRRNFLRAIAGTVTSSLVPSLSVSASAGAAGIGYGLSGQLWDGDGVVVKAWGGNIDEGVGETARTGFQGIEPFRQHIMQYLDNPAAFRRKLDEAGVEMLSCSNGGRGMSTNFIPMWVGVSRTGCARQVIGAGSASKRISMASLCDPRPARRSTSAPVMLMSAVIVVMLEV